MTEKALELFEQGFNCAQSVFAAFAPSFGLDEPTALKIAAPFGGMSRCGSVCGVVSGALMVLGLSMNRVDKDAREQLYAISKGFVQRFKSEHGSILCTDLLGCDVSTEEGLKKAREENIFRTVSRVREASDTDLARDTTPLICATEQREFKKRA